MKNLLLLLVLSLFSIKSFAGSCPDGSEPVKSVSADGTYFIFNCGGDSNEQSPSSSSSSNTKALAGIDIENDPETDFFRPPMKGYLNFQHKEDWQMADFNNDGYADIIYIGGMHTNQLTDEELQILAEKSEIIGITTGDACGDVACSGAKPLPQLFLGDENHNLTYANELIIDNREDPGMSLGKNILVADYNNDSVLDFYIPDHGLGTHDGVRDSYFLSQSNGTWIESSSTHLSHDNFVVFDHGGAVGDIDNDGDMDVVITNTGPSSKGTNTSLWCLMNDGTGFLKKRGCGGHFSFAIELGDFDGDGDLDLLQAGLEKSDCKHCTVTGIVWNDGRGNFSKHDTTHLPQHPEVYFTVPEVSMADLDNDGDLDIVLSRAGRLYVGTAVSIIENLGSRKFKDRGLIELRPAPAGYVSNYENNPWNAFVMMIKFRDLDKDGDMDVYLGGSAPTTNGMVLLNEGDFNFLNYMLSENGELSPITDIEEEREERIAELKKKQEAEKAKRLAKERENKKNNFKYSSRNFKTQFNLLYTQFSQVCDNVKREFNSSDFKSRTKKNTYFFISRDSNGKDCHYEWSSNEGNALRRCKQNNETDGQCTIYALGDNIVWGNPKLYKELTGRK
ncbi:VCBS repeat-containing protein [Candidatus Pseudothioglobus singularis]|nr:VCBS repeat-containing protein [Candidatus Pseudothioglobus singularis]